MNKMKELAKENVAISRELDKKDQTYTTLQEKLIKISNLKKGEMTEDPLGWKYLLAEN
jgi:hypothetical protein